MQKTIQNITIKLLALLLVFAVLLPAAIKLNHVFEDHEHTVCSEHVKFHIHEIDLDCEFYKFNLNTQYISLNTYTEIAIENHYHEISDKYYNFLNNHQQLSYSLRGPPVLV